MLGLSLAWNSQAMLGWLARESKALSAYAFPELALQGCTTMPSFTWVWDLNRGPHFYKKVNSSLYSLLSVKTCTVTPGEGS